MSRQPASLKRSMLYAALTFFGAAPLLVALLVANGTGESGEPMTADAPAVMDIRPHAKDSPAALLAAHGDDCWQSHETPPDDMVGVLPGHVIWQKPGGKTIYSADDELIGVALDEEIDHVELVPGHTVAFCR